MANIIRPKRSNTASNVPTTANLSSGELAVNMADQKVYINNGTAVVQVGAGKLSGLSDVTLSSLTTGQSISWNGTAWVNSSAGAGSVTSVGGTGTVVGLTLTGTVTTTGNLTLGGTFALPTGQVTTRMIYDTFTATAAQTTFTNSVTYTSGKIEVYVNGCKMRNGTDVTVTSGTSVVFASGLAVGSLVDLVYPT